MLVDWICFDISEAGSSPSVVCIVKLQSSMSFLSAAKWTIDPKCGIAISASSEMRYVYSIHLKNN